MSIIITFDSKGARLESVAKLAKNALLAKYPNAHISAIRKEPAETRPQRFADAQSLVSNAKSEFETLRDELQEWHDNMPEALQSSSKADELGEAVSQLDELIDLLEQAEGTDVEFPGMTG